MDAIDYSDAQFEFQCVRRHFFRNQNYFVTVFETNFILSIKKHEQNPKYRINFDLANKIGWDVKIIKNEQQIVAFAFKYNKKVKVLHAKHKELLKFKQLISMKISFEGIGEFYLPKSQIGKGSSASVYCAKYHLDQQLYAIKAIDKKFLQQNQNDNALLAYQMEVQILRTLSIYPDNFLNLKEIYEGDSTYYLVTDFLQGSSLSEEMQNAKTLVEQRLPSQVIRTIMKKLIYSLKIMHSHRLIHRDLKPDNLMFQRKYDYTSLVLVDFGLATSELIDKYLFPKCGTPGYVAPEVLGQQKEKYNQKVDMFSCGCIFYKLLTGHNLFQGQTFNEVLQSNKKCYINLDLPIDNHYITEDSLDLLNKLLTKNSKYRICSNEALKHSYFDNQAEFSTSIFKNPFNQYYEESNDEDHKINLERNEVNLVKTSPYKRNSLQNEIYSPNIGSPIIGSPCSQFYQKGPLSVLHCIKIKENMSPI